MTTTDQRCQPLPLMAPIVRWLPDKPRVRSLVPELIAKYIRLCCEGKSPWPLVLIGDAGSGKTCAALLLSDRAAGYYATARDFTERVRDAEFGRCYSESGYTISKWQVWRDWSTPALSILDELGTRERVSDHHYDVVKTCLDKREGKPAVYIANLDVASDFSEVYDDRVASRLSAGTIVKCVGDMRAEKVLTVGSLFSGIGGLESGLERAGMAVRWQVEIDDYCRRVLAKHWPNVKRYEDVRDVGSELERVDVVAGGFPCQPVSHAGKRKGDADERWLWDEFARVVREVRPRWVVAENVPGLLSADAGRLFGIVLRDLAACGYDAEWDCIPAAAVGAPHIRDRVFILANPTNDQRGRGQQRPEGGEGARHVAYADDKTEPTLPEHAFSWTGMPKNGGRGGHWATEPDVGRVAHGIPRRVDRLRGLGNAVVPQVAEYIGRLIVEADNA